MGSSEKYVSPVRHHVLYMTPEKLLVYNVKQGWKPLYDFLGCDLPTIALPDENIKGEIAEVPLSETRFGRQVILEIQRALFLILSVIVVIVGSFFVFFCD